jgi:hypothetical protein
VYVVIYWFLGKYFLKKFHAKALRKRQGAQFLQWRQKVKELKGQKEGARKKGVKGHGRAGVYQPCFISFPFCLLSGSSIRA